MDTSLTTSGRGPRGKQSEGGYDAAAFKYTDVGIIHEGKQIKLPADPAKMPLKTAIKNLQRKAEEEETMMGVHEIVEAFPWDGAIAFFKAMSNIFGWGTARAPKSFFDQTPTFVSVQVDVDEVAEFIWGDFEVPGFDGGHLSCGVANHNGRQVFAINGEVKRKDFHLVKDLAEETRRIVREHSIYRGKAFRMHVLDNGEIDVHKHPTFVDVRNVSESDLIFSHEIEESIQTNVFTPIKHTQACLNAQIPLRRGILLEGPYGVGKTLLASVAAKVCPENAWTFIVIDKVAALKPALAFAKLYEPCMIFAEDIDRVVKGERSTQMDDILNMIDGVAGKTSKIMTVLTTNAVQDINQAMLRPGRLDAVISLRPPNKEAVERLIRLYARGRLVQGEDVSKVAAELEGNIPAVIREVVEKAKMSALRHGQTNEQGELMFYAKDLLVSAQSMAEHIKLLNRDVKRAPTPTELLGESMAAIVRETAANELKIDTGDLRKIVVAIAKRTGTAVPPDLSVPVQ